MVVPSFSPRCGYATAPKTPAHPAHRGSKLRAARNLPPRRSRSTLPPVFRALSIIGHRREQPRCVRLPEDVPEFRWRSPTQITDANEGS
jgi:hypothetical protein